MTPHKPLMERPEFSPLSLARVLWKHKMGIGVVSVLLSIISVGGVYTLPAIYKAETLILVDSQKIPERYVAATVGTEVQDRLATISQQILSATRLQKIIETFDLYREDRKSLVQEEIIEKMRKDIVITLEKGWSRDRPGAFRVAYQGPNPAVVAEVANRIANFFIEENLRAREVQAEGTTEFIQNQLQQAKKTLDELEAKVSQYKLQHNGELPQQEATLVGALARLQIELQGNQDAINRAQQNKLMLENALSVAEVSESTLQQAVEAPPTNPSNPSASAFQKRSQALQAELDSLRSRYSDDHPEVKRLQGEIARVLEAEAKQPPKEVAAAEPQKADGNGTAPAAAKQAGPVQRPDVVRALLRERERVPNVRSQLVIADRELQFRNEERQRILRSIGSYQGRVEKLPIREQEMAAVTRDYEMAKANYKSLLDKKVSAEMATDMERRQKGERFTVLDTARIPEKPFKPNRPLLGALGGVLSLGIGVAMAVGRELKKNVLLGDWELPPDTFILGHVPRIEIAVPATDTSSPGPAGETPPLSREWRVAPASSALLLVLGVIRGVFPSTGGGR